MFYSRKKVEKPLVHSTKETTFAAALREKPFKSAEQTDRLFSIKVW